MKVRMPSATVESGARPRVASDERSASLWTIVLTCELAVDDSTEGSELDVLRVIESRILSGHGD